MTDHHASFSSQVRRESGTKSSQVRSGGSPGPQVKSSQVRRGSGTASSSLHRQVITTGGLICVHQGHHRVRNQGECYSSLSADSVLTQPRLWDCSLFFSPVGWPRVPRSSIAAGACTPFPSFHLPYPAVSIGIPDTPSPDTSPQFPESSKS